MSGQADKRISAAGKAGNMLGGQEETGGDNAKVAGAMQLTVNVSRIRVTQDFLHLPVLDGSARGDRRAAQLCLYWQAMVMRCKPSLTPSGSERGKA